MEVWKIEINVKREQQTPRENLEVWNMEMEESETETVIQKKKTKITSKRQTSRGPRELLRHRLSKRIFRQEMYKAYKKLNDIVPPCNVKKKKIYNVEIGSMVYFRIK